MEDPIRILLLLRGVTSYFPSRKPSKKEFTKAKAERIISLPKEDIEWDPNNVRFARAEESMVDSNLLLQQHPPPRKISALKAQRVVDSYNSLWGYGHSDHMFGQVLEATMTVQISSVKTSNRRYQVSTEELSKRWNISLHKAQLTTKVTTQRCVHTTLNPTLSRRYPTNDRHLRYNRLPCDLFTDTLIASIPSWHRQNKYAQIFFAPND